MINQDFHGWRLDGDVDGVQVSFFDPLHALDIHIKDADQVLSSYIFHSSLTENRNPNSEYKQRGFYCLFFSKWVLDMYSCFCRLQA